MTRSHVYHLSSTHEFNNDLVIDIAEALFLFVIWLIYIFTTTHLHVCQDSFTWDFVIDLVTGIAEGPLIWGGYD